MRKIQRKIRIHSVNLGRDAERVLDDLDLERFEITDSLSFEDGIAAIGIAKAKRKPVDIVVLDVSRVHFNHGTVGEAELITACKLGRRNVCIIGVRPRPEPGTSLRELGCTKIVSYFELAQEIDSSAREIRR